MTSIEATKPSRRSRLGLYWRAWWRTPVTFRIGLLIVLAQLLLAATGPFWCPYPFDAIGAGIPLSGASWAHPFGLDLLGRDVFSRVVYGTHIVILLSISGTVLGLVAGSALGLVSGYVGGWVDEAIQRLMEALVSIPFLVLGLLIVAAAGPTGTGNAALVIFVVAFVYMPRVARMARAAALGIITRDYVTVARLRGDRTWSVIWRELLPNATSVLLVEFAIRAGYAPVLIAALGFLGFGLAPPTPEWGLIISENRALIMTSPATVIGPGFMLATLVVGLNLCTEGLARILGRTAQLAPK
jgi:peptide/nickel transport system permease protein